MPATRTAAQQAASRANGACSRGPVSDTGKTRSARNSTRHGLRGGPFALLPGEEREEFVALHAAVTSDWGPRDAYERRWVMELVTSMWRQDRLRGLELATPNSAVRAQMILQLGRLRAAAGELAGFEPQLREAQAIDRELRVFSPSQQAEIAGWLGG